jgi:hypothetical protein
LCVQPDSDDSPDGDSDDGSVDGEYGDDDMLLEREASEEEDKMDVDDVPRPMAQHVVSLAHLGANS